MAQINLENLKSSGVYTFEYDASQTLSESSEYGRLVLGSSKTGPFNTIVQLSNDAQRKAIFGANDRALEKKGSYFHKTLEVSLREGPVYAMNVLPIDTVDASEDNRHKGSVSTFGTNANMDLSGENIATPIMHMFDRQKFWKASEQALLRVKNSETNPYKPLSKVKDNILLFSNASQNTVTIFVVKSSISGYDLTVNEWYKSQGDDVYIPTFLAEDDLISDYMVQVIAVAGDWTNYKKLAADSTYSRYFDTTGLKKTRLAEFIQLKTVNVLVNVTGSIIPDFQDDRGAIVSINKLFNNYYPSTQLMCAIDTDTLNSYDPVNGYDRFDIIGHGVFGSEESDVTNINVLSYKAPVKQQYIENPKMYKGDEKTEYLYDNSYIKDGCLWALNGYKMYEDWTNGYLVNGDTFTINNGAEGSDSPLRYVKIEKTLFTKTEGSEVTFKSDAIKITAYRDAMLTVTDYDFFKDSETPESDYSYTVDMCTMGQGDLYKEFDLTKSEEYVKTVVNEDGTTSKVTSTRSLSYEFDETTPNVIKLDVTDFINPNYEYELKNKIEGASPYLGYVKELVKYVKVNNYIKAETDENTSSRVLKIMSVAKKEDSNGKVVLIITTMSPSMNSVSGIEIYSYETIEGSFIRVSKGVQNFTNSLVGSKLSPFTITDDLLYNPKNTASINEWWKFLFEKSNLATAITESEEIDIRYIVDTFDGEISSSSKYWISKLAATHGKCMAFTNDPSFKQFEQCADPKFIDATTGLLNVQYIAEGGNLELNPVETYKFGSDTVNGMPIETFNYPVMPYLLINDGGVKRSMIPAPYACNAFMRKFKANAPYVIVAGVNTGKLTDSDILGVEYEFSKSDRDWLEPAGHNLIIQRRRDGVLIFSNNTAYQSVKSALNNAHVRDVLITIEKRIEKILFSFLFRYNTAVVRARVKSLVDNYLETVKLGSGIASYETQIDETNNDRYVLENNSAILDVKVDFNRGIHKFVNRVTITRAGGELSVVQSGFTEI